MVRRKKDDVVRTGEVSLETGDKIYTVKYDLLKSGVVRLQTGQAHHLGRLKEKVLARIMLGDIVDSGLADREGLGPKPKKEG